MPARDDQLSDADLVALANRGDAAGFEGLYARYRGWVAALALRFTGDDALALDVTQDTFMYLLGKFPGFKLTARMTTFLYPAVKNLSIAARRKARRLSGSPDEVLAALPAQAGGPGALEHQDLLAVVAALPDIHREVVLMRFVDDFSLDEIGQALGIPTGTIKSRLHHAIAALREDPEVRKHFVAE
ncbi:MAG: RNA polymerase sigma factor [Phycisphaerae bacterium]|nr:sigma-70 family RNA polymerase sigma factor [Tepidisphaeraceae bacterium]